MKKKYCYLTAIALLGLAACSEDSDLVDNGSGSGSPIAVNGRIPLTFRLDGLGSGSVPYTRAGEIALAGEKEIKTLDVFVFGKDTLPDGTEKTDGKMLLEEVFRSGVSEGITLSAEGAVTKAELSVMGNNRKRLYFVANGRDQKVLNTFELGVTDTLAFRDGLTDALTGHIACPLLMTTGMGLSVKDSIAKYSTDLTWASNIGVTLKRRVARFDIVNTGVDSQFFIEWIEQVNARKQNYLFEDAAHATPYFEASDLWNPERIDFKSLDNANNGETLAAFYAYAAPEGEDDEAKDFSIVLGGKSGSTGQGTAVLYPVLMQTDQEDPNTKLEVKANNRYVINIKSVGSNVITASIEVQDWIKADTVHTNAGYGTFGLSMPATDAKGTMAENTLTLTDATATTDIVVNVASASEWIAETDSEWIDLTGGTPAEGTVGKTLTFATTKANPRNDKSRIGKIVFRNKMRPSITQTLLVEQPQSTGDYLNVDMPKDITGLSIQGDTITLPGYDMVVKLPLAGTNAASVTAACDNADMVDKTERNGASDSIRVIMKANKTGKDREGILTVTDATASLEQKYRIIQKAQSLGMILLSGEGIVDRVLDLGAADTYAKDITVKASSAWKFDGDDDPTDGYTKEWITLGAATGSDVGDGSFSLTVTANDGFDPREIEIKVVNTQKESIFSMLTIKQAGKAETLTVSGTGISGNTLSIAKDAATEVTLTVTADLKDGDWELINEGTAVGDNDWLTLGTKNSNEFTVTPTANDTGIARSVQITIQKTGDDSVKQVITVTQAGV